jgi:hypothetical protein
MSRHPTQPVHRQGWQQVVTGHAIEALDGIYHVPFFEIRSAGNGPSPRLDALHRGYGTDREDLLAALKVTRTLRPDAGGLRCGRRRERPKAGSLGPRG